MTFEEWFLSSPHRAKYDSASPAYLAAREAWKAGQREALLEALTELQDNMTPGNSCYGEAYYDAQCSLCDDLRRMAKELE